MRLYECYRYEYRFENFYIISFDFYERLYAIILSGDLRD
jgi:hypothetical protein